MPASDEIRKALDAEMRAARVADLAATGGVGQSFDPLSFQRQRQELELKERRQRALRETYEAEFEKMGKLREGAAAAAQGVLEALGASREALYRVAGANPEEAGVLGQVSRERDAASPFGTGLAAEAGSLVGMIYPAGRLAKAFGANKVAEGAGALAKYGRGMAATGAAFAATQGVTAPTAELSRGVAMGEPPSFFDLVGTGTKAALIGGATGAAFPALAGVSRKVGGKLVGIKSGRAPTRGQSVGRWMIEESGAFGTFDFLMSEGDLQERAVAAAQGMILGPIVGSVGLARDLKARKLEGGSARENARAGIGVVEDLVKDLQVSEIERYLKGPGQRHLGDVADFGLRYIEKRRADLVGREPAPETVARAQWVPGTVAEKADPRALKDNTSFQKAVTAESTPEDFRAWANRRIPAFLLPKEGSGIVLTPKERAAAADLGAIEMDALRLAGVDVMQTELGTLFYWPDLVRKTMLNEGWDTHRLLQDELTVRRGEPVTVNPKVKVTERGMRGFLERLSELDALGEVLGYGRGHATKPRPAILVTGRDKDGYEVRTVATTPWQRDDAVRALINAGADPKQIEFADESASAAILADRSLKQWSPGGQVAGFLGKPPEGVPSRRGFAGVVPPLPPTGGWRLKGKLEQAAGSSPVVEGLTTVGGAERTAAAEMIERGRRERGPGGREGGAILMDDKGRQIRPDFLQGDRPMAVIQSRHGSRDEALEALVDARQERGGRGDPLYIQPLRDGSWAVVEGRAIGKGGAVDTRGMDDESFGAQLREIAPQRALQAPPGTPPGPPPPPGAPPAGFEPPDVQRQRVADEQAAYERMMRAQGEPENRPLDVGGDVGYGHRGAWQPTRPPDAPGPPPVGATAPRPPRQRPGGPTMPPAGRSLPTRGGARPPEKRVATPDELLKILRERGGEWKPSDIAEENPGLIVDDALAKLAGADLTEPVDRGKRTWRIRGPGARLVRAADAEEGMRVELHKRKDGKYTVRIVDVEAGERFPETRIFKSREQAEAWFEDLVEKMAPKPTREAVAKKKRDELEADAGEIKKAAPKKPRARKVEIVDKEFAELDKGAGRRPTGKVATGKEQPVYAGTGEGSTTTETVYAVVSAKDLTVSHDAKTLQQNPAFPQRLQNRVTMKAANLEKMAAGFSKDVRRYLSQSPAPDQGPPIVWEDTKGEIGPKGALYVVSGNHRATAIDRAEAKGLDAYKKELVAAAKELGITVPRSKNPKRLVRMIRDMPYAELQKRIQDWQGGTSFGLDWAERAIGEAQKAGLGKFDDVAVRWAPDEPLSQHNIDEFLRKSPDLAARVFPKGYEGAGLTAEQAATTMRAALAGVLPRNLVEKINRSGTEARSTLDDIAPQVHRFAQLVRDGKVDEAWDFTPHLARAFELMPDVAPLVAKGKGAAQEFAQDSFQGSLLEGTIDKKLYRQEGESIEDYRTAIGIAAGWSLEKGTPGYFNRKLQSYTKKAIEASNQGELFAEKEKVTDIVAKMFTGALSKNAKRLVDNIEGVRAEGVRRLARDEVGPDVDEAAVAVARIKEISDQLAKGGLSAKKRRTLEAERNALEDRVEVVAGEARTKKPTESPKEEPRDVLKMVDEETWAGVVKKIEARDIEGIKEIGTAETTLARLAAAHAKARGKNRERIAKLIDTAQDHVAKLMRDGGPC
jgi:hypothetical protein